MKGKTRLSLRRPVAIAALILAACTAGSANAQEGGPARRIDGTAPTVVGIPRDGAAGPMCAAPAEAKQFADREAGATAAEQFAGGDQVEVDMVVVTTGFCAFFWLLLLVAIL